MAFIKFNESQTQSFVMIIDILANFHNELHLKFCPQSIDKSILFIHTIRDNIVAKISIGMDGCQEYICEKKLLFECNTQKLLSELMEYNLFKTMSLSINNITHELQIDGTKKLYHY